MPLYTLLFNKVLRTGELPQEWVIGMLIPLYKMKGDKKDHGNYRGITLLSYMGKLFTAALNKRLTEFCEANNILNENQTGFRKGYSTVDHVYLFMFIIDSIRVKKKKLYCAFIEYKKAFDCVLVARSLDQTC